MTQKNNIYQVLDEKTIGNSASYKNNVVVASTIEQRNSFWPGTYEAARPYDAVPFNFKDVIKLCRYSYLKSGVVRNVIDLMTDFTCEDLKFIHTDKKVEAFFRVWGQKVKIYDVVNEFVRHSLLDANVVVKRYTAKLNKPIEDQWTQAAPDLKLFKEKRKTLDKEIRVRYSFLNILSLNWEYDNNSPLKKKLTFKVNPLVLTKLRDSNSSLHQSLYRNAPDIADVLKKSDSYDVDMSKVYVSHNKKDSWDDWAPPFLYSILGDLNFKNKLRQAEMAALDGVINVIRLWRLGDHKEKILPAEGAFDRLLEILETNTGGGAVDILWDSMIDMQEYYPPIKDILGPEKYTQVDKDILIGLGIPDVLLGGSGSNFSNSFIQLKTIVERLKALRNQVMDWLNYEIALVCEGMNIKVPPYVSFGQMNLDDEDTTKKLILELLDRGAISLEAVLDVYGQNFLIEVERIKQEKENGLKLKSPLDEKPKTPTSNNSMNGRPPGSKDTEKRQRKNIKIRTKASMLVKGLDIIDAIDEHVVPYYMQQINVSNARKLTNQQKDEVDKLRMVILSCIKPTDIINKDYLINKLDNLTEADSAIYASINQMVQEYIEEHKQEPSIDQKKRIQAIAWAANFTETEDEKSMC